MASRRDQLQSYQFRSQRVVTAFVMRETDPAQSPLRRGVSAVFVGAMIAVMVAAGFGVYGILTKTGGNTWKVDGGVVVEKETGASFVYAERALHPTVNYASALLASGKNPPVVHRVAARSLRGVPRTTTIGIPDAPASLPSAKQLVGPVWTACSIPTTDAAGAPSTVVQLSAQNGVPGSSQLKQDDGILATDSSSKELWLLWQGHRFHVDTSIQVYLFANTTPVALGPALLDTLPAGADISDIPVPKAGQTSNAVPSHKNGDVLVAQTGSGPLYFLVFDDGLATLTELQKDIAVKSGGSPMQIDVNDADKARKSTRLQATSGAQAPPVKPPHLAMPAARDAVCATFDPRNDDPVITEGGQLTVAGVPTAKQSSDKTVLADLVAIPSGRAALVVAQPAPGADPTGYFLITDNGMRYSVPTANEVQFLGYDPTKASLLSAAVLARIPQGPQLDQARALLAPSTG
jgi:type VII secretion protein EccB